MKNISKVALLSFILSVSSQSFAAELPLLPDFDTANAAYKEKDYTEAARHWMELAHRGDMDAQTGLGKLYMRGLGVKQDERTALNLFMEAAKQGDEKAMFELGRAYEKGYGVQKNPEKAKEWYALSYRGGYARGGTELQRLNGIEVSAEKAAKEKKKYRFVNDVRLQFVGEENLDLGTRDDELETAGLLNARSGLYLYPTEDITTYVEARALLSEGVASSNNDDDADSQNLNFVELRQAWVEVDNIGGHKPAAVKIGRQRFREDRGLWWNRDLDAARVSYDTTLTKGFVAVGENQAQYRIGNDNEFDRDEEDRLRVLSELSHQYKKDQFIEARFLFEDDHSGTYNVGQNVNADDRDDDDFSLAWFGLRAKGKNLLFAKEAPKVSYRVDIIGMTGEATNVSTTSGPSSDVRTVSAVNTRDALGFAFDGGLDVELPIPLSPTLSVGYAYGSGDDGSGDSSAFRQSGLDGNTSQFPEEKVSNSLRNYGEVLRPELSNIHILNTGVTFPVLQASDLSLNYFSYWLDDKKTGLQDDGISARLNGQDSHVGQALDLSTNLNIGEELNLPQDYLKNTALRFKLGTFKAGKAYGAQENEYAFRGSSEVRMKF